MLLCLYEAVESVGQAFAALFKALSLEGAMNVIGRLNFISTYLLGEPFGQYGVRVVFRRSDQVLVFGYLGLVVFIRICCCFSFCSFYLFLEVGFLFFLFVCWTR